MKPRTLWLVFAVLFILTLVGQARFVADFAVPIEGEPDGELYLSLAHDYFGHGASGASPGPAQTPNYLDYLRLPGYPAMMAGVFALCGQDNLDALRRCQALLATLTAAFVAALAFLWEPDPARRLLAALAAFVLAAVCPFTAIYGAVIQAETLTIFLAVLLVLAATLAFRARRGLAATVGWAATGLLAGAVQLVRPESGLFAAAVGFTLGGFGFLGPRPDAEGAGESSRRNQWRSVLWAGAVFSCAFIAALVPRTVHNARVFHVFSPLPPANLVMPGEIGYDGFRAWYRTWADSERYLQPFYWDMTDNKDASVDNLPSGAIDSSAEYRRTAALFDRYNAPGRPEAASGMRRAGLTPELDTAFAQLARERKARSPWRYHVALPLSRAMGLWFVPHAQYYDFEGSLFPLSDMPTNGNAHFWLPVFFALTGAYSLLGLAGAWRLARTPPPACADAWRWLGLVLLIILLRWAYLATLENTEPRYMVEVFPFLCVLGGLAVAGIRTFVSSTPAFVPSTRCFAAPRREVKTARRRHPRLP